jgi:hypothetical protein
MSPSAYALLPQVNASALFVPVTTRTIEQYNRISLLENGAPDFALVCNGAVLLHDGVVDEEWLSESKAMFGNTLAYLNEYVERLKEMLDIFYDVRIVEDFFIFAKHVTSDNYIDQLSAFIDASLFSINSTFDKIYIMPKHMDKGCAVKRFLKLYGADQPTVSAGDSVMDLPMLAVTDRAFVPYDFPFGKCFINAPDERFDEYILMNV